ncbi:tyrosine-type recombinase/integrase [Pseudomonas sp. G5(2012)]|uniref:tyrosine-type recombinase/integrase n=1 Tax=Pseudomonas sp. G5(2012) TaxID=1268068 RepID=UPI0003430FA0|nr:tyrosine-type recombinase/integrase [Pseudomonas sp. G5(2012)]EPA94924.1 hypothetical protein PG5_45700 [Pseudomonas sp. G5(2012)]
MAVLVHIRFKPTRIVVEADEIRREHLVAESKIKRLPQVLWGDGTPWREANLWAYQRAKTRDVSIKTVQSNMGSIAFYANWLEQESVQWWDFPARRDHRCLIRYRGFLIDTRENGTLAPSTVSQRMRDVISFYRWMQASGLLRPEWPMWKEHTAKILLINQFGLERTLSVNTTDLAIKNRKRSSSLLEDGLLPIPSIDRDHILQFAKENSSQELYLLLLLGIYTGMRIGTLCNLKVETLQNASPDPATPSLFRLNVGPGAKPSVHTKHSVTGQVWITKPHLEDLLEYCYSSRRLLRVAKGLPEHKNIIFLTRFGNPYNGTDSNRSSAINVEMLTLRRKAAAAGLKALDGFHFHQTRCTYATELAKILIPIGGATNALALIKDALLHKDEATSLKYIKFVEKFPAKIAYANEFSRLLLGLISSEPSDEQP